MINVSSTTNYERFSASDGQTEFKLSRAFVPGTQAVFVYVNGILQLPDFDFTEESTNTIKLASSCYEGDLVLVSHLKQLPQGIKIGTGDIVGSKATSLFKRYSGEQRLLPNQKYTFSLHILDKDYEYSFSSSYSPFYSSTKIIRQDLLHVLDEISDSTIEFQIWQSSKSIADDITTYTDDDGNPLPAAKNWVRYRAEIDLVHSIYMQIATNIGSTEKSIGEVKVSRSINLPYLSDLMATLKSKLAKQEMLLKGIRTVGKAVTKAGGTSYPITQRRSF